MDRLIGALHEAFVLWTNYVRAVRSPRIDVKCTTASTVFNNCTSKYSGFEPSRAQIALNFVALVPQD
jgi:hypothetical protein